MFELQNEEMFHFDIQLDSDDIELEMEGYRPDNREEAVQSPKLFAYSTRGTRSYNYDQFDYIVSENYIIAGIYDGHGDGAVSLYLKNNLLNKIVSHKMFSVNAVESIVQCIKDMEDYILNNLSEESGSTLLIVLCTKNSIVVVNLGDSQSYALKNKEENNSMILLNTIHDLNNQREIQAIKKKGGLVLELRGSKRLMGQLNISRSIGDKMYKQWMISNPEITMYPQSSSIKEIIMGSDGANQIFKNKGHQSLSIIQTIKSRSQDFRDNATVICFENPFCSEIQ